MYSYAGIVWYAVHLWERTRKFNLPHPSLTHEPVYRCSFVNGSQTCAKINGACVGHQGHRGRMGCLLGVFWVSPECILSVSWLKSNQIKSEPIKSNQVKSNESNSIKETLNHMTPNQNQFKARQPKWNQRIELRSNTHTHTHK